MTTRKMPFVQVQKRGRPAKEAPKAAPATVPTEVGQVLAERGSRYGTFESNAHVAQGLKAVMRSGASWHKMTETQKEALEMVQHKIARMVNGDPTYLDNAVDLVGYATLMKTAMEDYAKS